MTQSTDKRADKTPSTAPQMDRRDILQLAGMIGAGALTASFAAGASASTGDGEFVLQLDGAPIDVDTLVPLAFAGFAHATYFQVRGGRMRGLDVHLKRLRDASMQMYGSALPDDQVRAYLGAAVNAGPADLSVMATVFSASGEFTVAREKSQPHMLVRTVGPSSGPSGPLSLDLVEYERDLPEIKHVGEVGKTYYMNRAAARGFDDAAFVDRRGRISEGTIWNLAFWDGETVIWPDAEILLGSTMAILRRQLDRLGMPQRVQEVRPEDLPDFSGAVVMNSWTPGIPVSRIGSVAMPDAPEFLTRLDEAFTAEKPVQL